MEFVVWAHTLVYHNSRDLELFMEDVPNESLQLLLQKLALQGKLKFEGTWSTNLFDARMNLRTKNVGWLRRLCDVAWVEILIE